MNKDYKNIDELVSQNLNSFEMDFDDGAWAEMETMLDKQPKGFWQRFEKNKGIHLLAIGLLGTLSCCWAWWFFVQQPLADASQIVPTVQQATIISPVVPKTIQSLIPAPETTIDEVLETEAISEKTKQHVLSPADAIVNASDVKGHEISVPKLEINESTSISTNVNQENKNVLDKAKQINTEQSLSVDLPRDSKEDIKNTTPIINKENINKEKTTPDTPIELDQKPNKIKSLSEYESEVVWLEKGSDHTNASILSKRNESSIDELPPYESKITSLNQTILEGELASAEMPIFNKKTPFRLSVKGMVGANMNFTNFSVKNNEMEDASFSNGIRQNNKDQWSSGTTVGLGVNVGMGNHWSIETAFLSSKRNYISMDVISPDYIWGQVSGIEYNINAWEIPLLIQYDFGNKAIRPFVAAGPSVYRLQTEQYVFHAAPTTEEFLNDYSGSSASRFESNEVSPVSNNLEYPSSTISSGSSGAISEADANLSMRDVAYLPSGDVRSFLGGIFNIKAGANWRIAEKHSLSLSALYQTTLNKKRFELSLSDHEVQNYKHLQSLGLEVGWLYRLK